MSMKLFVLPLAAASLAAVAGLFLGDALGFVDGPLTWVRRPSLAPDRYQSIGQSETHNGVTFTLKDVGFTSSETVLEFVVEGFEPPAGGFVRTVLLHEPSMEFTGVGEGEPLVDASSAGDNRFVVTIRVGPAESPGKEITVVIRRLLVLTSAPYGAGGTSTVEGAWAFRFVPGVTAADPVDEDVYPALQEALEGKRVKLERIHSSSSGLQVYYSLESTQPGFLGVDHWPARIVLPDGSWIPGRAAQDDPGQSTGDLRVDFDALPAGTQEIKVVFGPFLRELEGPFVFNIDVSAGAGVSPERFTIAGEPMEVSIVDGPDGFGVALTNVGDGPGTVVWVGPPRPSLVDNRWNGYKYAGAGWNGGRDEYGASISLGGTFSFAGALDPAATVVTLTVPKMARLEYGPEFTVLVPSEIGR